MADLDLDLTGVEDIFEDELSDPQEPQQTNHPLNLDLTGIENVGIAKSKHPANLPKSKRTSVGSGYGVRSDPFSGRPTFHDGADWPTKLNTPLTPFKNG